MAIPVVSGRYVTADFRQSPFMALADLMGLSNYQAQLAKAPEVYAPILNGIAVYRHLPSQERSAINAQIIYDIPRNSLTTRLMDLISDLSVQRFWYMWSLSDAELQEFFEFSSRKRDIAGQFNPLSFPEVTVTSVASWVYVSSRGGPRALASEALASLGKTELVEEVARKFGWAPKLARSAGITAVPTLIVLSGLNIMAKHESDKARRELAARGLLVYEDL